jgi:hypothetical protein
MDSKEFEKLVSLGLGRAVLQLLERPTEPFREVILDACLNNKAYDAQIEGSRAEYMMDLMRLTGDLPFYADAVLEGLKKEAEDWDTWQRFRIARLLAQEGSQRAREGMREAFSSSPESMISSFAEEFIELDGIEGLLYVVDRRGEQLRQNSEKWEDDYFLSVAADKCGKEVTKVALKDAAGKNQNVRAYLRAVEENRVKREKRKQPRSGKLTYDEIRSLIENGKDANSLVKWSQTATEPELQRAARDLAQATDPRKLKRYLLLFRKRRFPLEYEPLFRLLELPDGPVPRHALVVLANLEDEKVRGLAFNLVESKSSLRGYAIDLLVKNFRDGDHAVIEGWCDAEENPPDINAYDRSLREFFVAHPNPATELRLLTKLYEKEPCAHCRCHIVDRLLKLGGLTETLRRECEHDSYKETRKLVMAQATPN